MFDIGAERSSLHLKFDHKDLSTQKTILTLIVSSDVITPKTCRTGRPAP